MSETFSWEDLARHLSDLGIPEARVESFVTELQRQTARGVDIAAIEDEALLSMSGALEYATGLGDARMLDTISDSLDRFVQTENAMAAHVAREALAEAGQPGAMPAEEFNRLSDALDSFVRDDPRGRPSSGGSSGGSSPGGSSHGSQSHKSHPHKSHHGSHHLRSFWDRLFGSWIRGTSKLLEDAASKAISKSRSFVEHWAKTKRISEDAAKITESSVGRIEDRARDILSDVARSTDEASEAMRRYVENLNQLEQSRLDPTQMKERMTYYYHDLAKTFGHQYVHRMFHQPDASVSFLDLNAGPSSEEGNPGTTHSGGTPGSSEQNSESGESLSDAARKAAQSEVEQKIAKLRDNTLDLTEYKKILKDITDGMRKTYGENWAVKIFKGSESTISGPPETASDASSLSDAAREAAENDFKEKLQQLEESNMDPDEYRKVLKDVTDAMAKTLGKEWVDNNVQRPGSLASDSNLNAEQPANSPNPEPTVNENGNAPTDMVSSTLPDATQLGSIQDTAVPTAIENGNAPTDMVSSILPDTTQPGSVQGTAVSTMMGDGNAPTDMASSMLPDVTQVGSAQGGAEAIQPNGLSSDAEPVPFATSYNTVTVGTTSTGPSTTAAQVSMAGPSTLATMVATSASNAPVQVGSNEVQPVIRPPSYIPTYPNGTEVYHLDGLGDFRPDNLKPMIGNADIAVDYPIIPLGVDSDEAHGNYPWVFSPGYVGGINSPMCWMTPFKHLDNSIGAYDKKYRVPAEVLPAIMEQVVNKLAPMNDDVVWVSHYLYIWPTEKATIKWQDPSTGRVWTFKTKGKMWASKRGACNGMFGAGPKTLRAHWSWILRNCGYPWRNAGNVVAVWRGCWYFEMTTESKSDHGGDTIDEVMTEPWGH